MRAGREIEAPCSVAQTALLLWVGQRVGVMSRVGSILIVGHSHSHSHM